MPRARAPGAATARCRGRVGQARTADPSPPGVQADRTRKHGRTGHGRRIDRERKGRSAGAVRRGSRAWARGAVHQRGRSGGRRGARWAALRHAAAGPTGSRAGIADLAGQGAAAAAAPDRAGCRYRLAGCGRTGNAGCLRAHRVAATGRCRPRARRSEPGPRRRGAILHRHALRRVRRAECARQRRDHDAHRITASAIHMAGRVRKEAEHMSADYIGADPRAG